MSWICGQAARGARTPLFAAFSRFAEFASKTQIAGKVVHCLDCAVDVVLAKRLSLLSKYLAVQLLCFSLLSLFIQNIGEVSPARESLKILTAVSPEEYLQVLLIHDFSFIVSTALDNHNAQDI